MRNLSHRLLWIAIVAVGPNVSLADTQHTPQSSPGGQFQAYGKVLKVTPIVRREQIVEPFEECRIVQDRRQTRFSPHHRQRIEPPHRVLRGIIGSVIGGAVGHQFGGGRGKDALTVLGAIAGARIASGPRRSRADAQEHYPIYHDAREPVSGRIEQCTQSERSRSVDRVTGYRVRYRYNGETFTKITTEHPGDRIALAVRITPRIQASR